MIAAKYDALIARTVERIRTREARAQVFLDRAGSLPRLGLDDEHALEDGLQVAFTRRG